MDIVTGALGNLAASAFSGVFVWLLGRRHGDGRPPAFIERHVAAVEAYLDASMRYLDEVEGMACIWGSSAPLESEQYHRLFRFVNFEVPAQYNFVELGNASRSAAGLMDGVLSRLMLEAESAKVGITGVVNCTSPGQSVTRILRQVEKARRANAKVADRLRKLQS